MTVQVVKIGGSLTGSAELLRWLDVIATAGVGKVVLVPGGGPWADEVREAQKREGFDDRVAHRRALRAMEKYGKTLARTRANLVPAGSIAQINAALHDGRIPVWMPHDMVVADASIRESWDVTSDSLAAWLARQLNAATLLLVKSLKIDGPQPGIEDLVRRGWVDPAFAEFASTGYLRVVLLGQGDQGLAQGILR
jgi:aspartokinase-like uncharacterized kinase